jgi:hypothetical protein
MQFESNAPVRQESFAASVVVPALIAYTRLAHKLVETSNHPVDG